MEYSLSSSLVGGSGSINPDALSLDLQFATDKTLTARKGPTPVLTRANTTATFVGSNGTIQDATTNVARFDHDKSYSSAYLVLSGSPVDVNSNAVDIAGPIEFTGWDGNSPVQFPQFEYSNLQILVNGGNWLVSANDGDFQAQRPIVNGINGAYTVINGSGTLTVTAVHPCKGLLIEEQRQNILTNTNGDLSTQTKTVTAVQHTLSFYGTGQIVLSGAATAVVSPAGNYGDRKTLTFTPSAGSLILTVTGSVQFAQLEIGAFATSFIPTSGTSLVRSADVCSITGSNFTGMWNRFAGTGIASISSMYSNSGRFVANNIGARALEVYKSGGNTLFFEAGGAQEIIISSSSTIPFKAGVAYAINDYQGSFNGTLGGVDTNTGGTIPNATSLSIGNLNNGNFLNGTISSIRYYKKRLPNAKLQTLTT